MIQAGALMHRLAAHRHPTPCHAPSKAAAGASAARTAICSRVAAFRDAPIPHSCSVDTAHAVVTSSSAGDTVHDVAQQAAALPWQPLTAGSALSRVAGSTYHAVEAAAAAVAAAAEDAHVASSEHVLLQQHHVLPQQHAQPHAHYEEQQQQQQVEHAVDQHSTPQHSQAAAAAGQATSAAESWLAQHSAAVAQWRLLSEPGQDETSAVILSCSSVQQLLGVAERLLAAPVSKWHYARLAAMAAVLSAQQLHAHSTSWARVQHQQQGQQSHSVQQSAASFRTDVGSNGSSSSSDGSSLDSYHHHHQHIAPLDQQHVNVSLQLACRVLEAVTCPCIDTGAPAVHSMRGAHLSETLHAVQLLLTQASSTQLQPQQQSLLQLQQQRLQQQLARMPDALLLSAIHGCSTVNQLHSVVAVAARHCRAGHVKAGFVQLARSVINSSSSSSTGNSSNGGEVWQQLLSLLPEQLGDLQPHHCASILWSLGQLQPMFGSPINSSSSISSGAGAGSVQQQLLQGALAGLERLNPRVCAQLLHGAARLQLHIPASSLQLLQQHTQLQLPMCDPHALSSMLWSFATLHTPDHGVMPDPEWLQAFYSSSWNWLQPSATVSSSSSSASSSNGVSTHRQQQQEEQPWRRKDTCCCFEPVELSALLTAACRLQLQPPGGWLAAVADSCSRQMGSFQQQELGLLLYCFAKLQYVPPRGLLAAVAARALQLGPEGFKPHTLSLLLYGMTRLQRWHTQQQPQQQQMDRELGVQCLASLGVVQLDQATANDLALLAWCLGQQAVLQRQTQQQQQQQHSHGQLEQVCSGVLPSLLAVLQAVLQAATVKLQQQQFTPQGLGMLLWGCGTALQATAAGSSGGSGGGGGVPQPALQLQQQEPVDTSVLTAFVEAAAAAALQYAKAFSGHELSSVVWGLGAAGAAAVRTSRCNSSSSSTSGAWRLPGSSAATECLDVLFCRLLDASDQLSNYQLRATIQGYSWLQHPRGLDLLHMALQSHRHSSRLSTAQPRELLVLLRACVQYKYVPDGASWGAVVVAIERMRPQLQGTELAQLLYVLGKLQMLSNRRTKQRAAQAAAAAAAEAAAASSAWSTRREQRRQSRVQSQQQQQALPHVTLKALGPDALLEQLLLQAGRCLGQCGSKDVSLMLWGVSQLDRHRQHAHPQQRQHKQAWGSSDTGAGDNGTKPGSGSGAAVASAAGHTCTCVVQQCADQVYGPLLSSVYAYTYQQLESFAPGNLATLLYALQRLHARPDTAWLQTAALQFTEERLSSMDGQSLAVLALALAGLNWVPTQSWLGAFVRAVAAADKRGALVTTWQRQCISNSVAALNPLAGQAWLP